MEEKSKKNSKNNPSFSSTLLDEIYRSIDHGIDEKNSEEIRVQREIKNVKKSSKNYNSSSNNVGGASKVDEEMANLKRACLIKKWMENEKVYSRRIRPNSFQENDPLFFSSTSTSSDSSSGGLSSSSDTDFFSSSSSKSKKSCFVSPWPKPIKTDISRHNIFNEYQNSETITKDHQNLIKSKSRALKIYANLKKVKQPISPGARLTSFINNLFTNVNAKKSSKNPSANRGSSYEDVTNVARKKESSSSNCSSASSFSRSCLSKTPPSSSSSTSTRAKMSDDCTKRRVRFYPVSVIVDEDCRPCGHKSIYDFSESKKYGCRPQLPQKLQQRNQDQNYASSKIGTLRTCGIQKEDIEVEDYDDFDDAASDSSSDLFEIDFGNHRFCEELPVYETTHLRTNLAIASGLIR